MSKRKQAVKIHKESFESEIKRLARIIPSRSKPKPVRQPPSHKSSFDLHEIFDDVFSSIRAMTSKPMVILSLVLVTALVLTHQNAFNQGVIGKWVNSHKANNTFAKWIDENQQKFLGATIFVPTLFDVPKPNQLAISVGAALWVFLVPQFSIYEYAIQSFSLHTFFRVKKSVTRTAIVIFVAAAYYFGFLTKS